MWKQSSSLFTRLSGPFFPTSIFVSYFPFKLKGRLEKLPSILKFHAHFLWTYHYSWFSYNPSFSRIIMLLTNVIHEFSSLWFTFQDLSSLSIIISILSFLREYMNPRNGSLCKPINFSTFACPITGSYLMNIP